MRDLRGAFPYQSRLILPGIGAVGLMLADTPGNFVEETPVDGSPGPRGEDTILRDDFSGGIGQRISRNDPSTDSSLYKSSGAAANTGVDGSYGPLLPAFEVVSTTVEAALCIYSIAEYNGAAYMAIGPKVYSSINKLFTDAVVSYTAGTNVTKLVVYQGTQSAIPLLFGACANGAYITYDGTSWATDASTALRTVAPKSVLFTADGGTNYTDLTSALTDVNIATTSGTTLNSMNTLAQLDWILLGSDAPYQKINVTIGNANGTASVMTAAAWDGDSWEAVAIVDGTIAAGATLAVSGSITFTRPAAWARLAATAALPAFYYLRLVVSVQLDASVSITELSIGMAEEADDFDVNGPILWKAFDSFLSWSETGGRTAVWNKTSDPAEGAGGTVIGMASVLGITFAKWPTALAAPDEDGSSVPYMPSLFKNPATAGEGFIAGDDTSLLFSHDTTLYRLSLPNIIDSIGPERLVLGDDEALAVRMTAGVKAKGQWHLFGYNDEAAESWLYKLGSWRQLPNPDNGVLEWQIVDGIHRPMQLGARKITAAATYKIGDQPYLLFGDAVGVVSKMILPRGTSPLEAASGCRFTTSACYGDFPSFLGRDPTRIVTVYAWTAQARNLRSGVTVALQSKGPDETTWTAQGTSPSGGDRRMAFATVHALRGLDLRLILTTDTATRPPIVDSLALHFQQPIRVQQLLTAIVDVDDGNVDLLGRWIPRTADALSELIDIGTKAELPFLFLCKFGHEHTVLIKARQDTALKSRQGHTARRGVTLVMAHAA